MKTLLLVVLLLIPVSAFALGDATIEYCFTTSVPKACLQAVSADAQQRQLDHQREMLDQQIQIQLQAARIQANGLMLFGTGPALIDGVNQGFHAMHQPYVSTPYFHYGP